MYPRTDNAPKADRLRQNYFRIDIAQDGWEVWAEWESWEAMFRGFAEAEDLVDVTDNGVAFVV